MNEPIGTWTIIHSDGTSTTIKTERTGDLSKAEPNLDDDEEDMLVFVYMDGRVRMFPLTTIFEISFVPENEDE